MHLFSEGSEQNRMEEDGRGKNMTCMESKHKAASSSEWKVA